MRRIYGITMLAALVALAAAAQDASSQSAAEQKLAAQADVIKSQLDETIAKLKMTVIRTEGGVMSNVKNAPYRADQITETTQTLGDGTRIHNERKVTIYRDSQGRVRREMPNEVSIMDPNAGVAYTLNTNDMTYRKMGVSVAVNAGKAGPGIFTFTQTGVATTAVGGGGRGGEDFQFVTRTVQDGTETATLTLNGQTVNMTPNKESLGTQSMEGVSAQGERRTSTIEAGAIGNDRPIQIVNERWYSPALQVEVMTRRSDPRTGEEITRLTNIDRAEPDPSLFAVPPAYQLIEGKGGRGGRGGGQ